MNGLVLLGVGIVLNVVIELLRPKPTIILKLYEAPADESQGAQRV